MDTVKDSESPLCDICERLCTGHWCEKPYGHHPDSSHWVQVENQDHDIVVEALHHTIWELRKSAHSGCQLCAIILGSLSEDSIKLLSVTDEALPEQKPPRTTYELRPWGLDIIIHLFFHSGNNIDFQELLLTPMGGKIPTRCKTLSSQETFSNESLSQAIYWLHECETYHSLCKPATTFNIRRPRMLPARLLDVGTVDSPELRLVNSQGLAGNVEYFTLSHCWGGELPMKLTSCRLDKFQSAVEYEKLPLTFKDALRITRILKSRYLWIDALCIIQDSAEDWEHESSIMSEVFANSRLSLAATASLDSHGGLRRQRDPRLFGACVLSPHWTGLDYLQQQYICTAREVWRNNVDNAPLQRRGWVLQERLLAPRILHFAEKQLFWECCTKCACESIPTELPLSISTQLKGWFINSLDCNEQSRRWELQAKWPGIVAAYSKGALTYEKDKLVAISGIAKRMIEMWEGSSTDYLAGLWRDSLPHEMLWKVDSDGQFLGSKKISISPKYGRAPSWSWVAINTPILVPSLYTEHLQVEACHCLIRISETEVIPPNSLTASITKGHIRLKGPMCRIRKVMELTIDPTGIPVPGRRGLSRSSSIHWKIDGKTMPGFEYSLDHDPYSSSSIQTYHFVAFFESVVLNPKRTWLTGMILQPTGRADGEYQRCGVLNVVDDKARAMFKVGFERQTILKEEFEEASADRTYTIKIV